MNMHGVFGSAHTRFAAISIIPGMILMFPYLMTVTHLSESGKEKLKTGTSFPSFDGLRINRRSDKRQS